ncbi:MAG TPA: ATP synthase F1 subunit gamma [Chryseolinea sp.]|nr:ATP synthase F1 subunit gamma [Chryseolinea sp.]
MPNLKEVKNRIASVVSTQQITKAMKMVAAAKLRRSQERVTQMRPYAVKLDAIIQNLSEGQTTGDVDNWFSKVREEKRILIVAISSDRGLCGSFNSNIFKGVMRLVLERYEDQYKKGNIVILPIGKKATEYFRKRNFQIIDSYSDIIGSLNFDKAAEVGDAVMKAFKEGKFDKVELVYNEFKNVATQVLRTEQLLPVVLPTARTTAKTNPVDYIFQPSYEEIISEVLPTGLKIQLYKALLDSNAAENGARMTAMDKATENAGELLKELRLSYNRSRQAAITKEILEIVGGAEALKSA